MVGGGRGRRSGGPGRRGQRVFHRLRAMNNCLLRRAGVWICVAACVLCGGCSSNSNKAITREPLTVLRNPQQSPAEREKAIDVAWQQALKNPEDMKSVRATFKDMTWSAQLPLEMRAKMYRYLASDPNPAAVADTQRMTRLMLPREPDRGMVAVLSQNAADKGWKDCIPALIRSYSRVTPKVPDRDRSEKLALVILSGETPLVQTVFEVFLDPPEEDPDSPADFKERTRADAYDVLGKLDTTGEYRKKLLEDPSLAASKSQIVELLRKALAELRVIPITGDELRWLQRLGDPKNTRNAEWWQQCAGIVAQLPPDKLEGLRLRHLEPIRVAATYQQDIFKRDRAQLLSDLAPTIAGRKTPQRSDEDQGLTKAAKEQFDGWQERYSWGDLVTMHVLDRGVRTKEFSERIFMYASMDREDKTTEYGGGILTLHNIGDGRATSNSPGDIVAWLFPPRPGQRQGDNEFVASEEMILQSDRALAQFHFHVQRVRNADVAGPSAADLAYSRRSGRACLVFTSIAADEMDVDYYQPDGIVVDLGTIVKK